MSIGEKIYFAKFLFMTYPQFVWTT